MRRPHDRRSGRLGSGFVRWPRQLSNSREGGMFVYAVVDGDPDGRFEACHGVACADVAVKPAHKPRAAVSGALSLDETLVETDAGTGDIRLRCPTHGVFFWDYAAGDPFGQCPRCGAECEDLGQFWPVQDRWFPWAASSDDDPDIKREPSLKYRSVDLLASVCLGASDGSWFDDRAGRYWTCTREDLMPEGKALLDSLELLYGQTPTLLTFLDT